MITTVTVNGMLTEHCKRAVFTSLAGIPGIHQADVQIGTVAVTHDGSVTIAQLTDAIAVAGYTVVHGVEDRRTLPVV